MFSILQPKKAQQGKRSSRFDPLCRMAPMSMGGRINESFPASVLRGSRRLGSGQSATW